MADAAAQQQQLQQFRAELQNQMVQGTLPNQLRTQFYKNESIVSYS